MRAYIFLLGSLFIFGCSDDGTGSTSNPSHDPQLDSGTTFDARTPVPVPFVDAAVDASPPKPPRPTPLTRSPMLMGPVDGTALTLSPGASDGAPSNPTELAKYGYVEKEFFISGTASSYKSTSARGLDGKWAAERDKQAPYVTRMVVRYPMRAADFNGTAIVEWLNVTGQFDTEIAFAFAWEEILRGGYAYVGVTVQQAGSDNLKLVDSRYAPLVHPGDTFAYDIFAQAGAAVGWPAGASPLGDLEAERVIAYGESQSAMRMITYVNAIHPLTKVYDALFVHSRAGWGAAIGDESNALLGDGTPVQVRADLGTPVLQLFTESEIVLILGPAYAARQPDSDMLRTWEVAGTAHADTRLLGKGTDLLCGGASVNDGPQHYVVKAAFRALHRWLADGVQPAHGAELTLNDDKSDLARDPHGNALGGVRTPAVDVPIATNSGVSFNPACTLFGMSAPFGADTLRSLYPTHQDYVSKVQASAQDARVRGFVLPEEEASIDADARDASVPPL